MLNKNQIHADYKINHVIDQLKEYGYHDTDGLTYRELIHKLAVAKAIRVKAESPHATWF